MIVKYSQVFPYWIYGDNKIGTENTLEQWLNKNGHAYDNTFKVNELSKDNIIVITQNANIKYIHIRKAFVVRAVTVSVLIPCCPENQWERTHDHLSDILQCRSTIFRHNVSLGAHPKIYV